jgi:hypothetical protein
MHLKLVLKRLYPALIGDGFGLLGQPLHLLDRALGNAFCGRKKTSDPGGSEADYYNFEYNTV